MCFIFTSKGGSQDETLFNFVNNFENTNDCRFYLDYSKSSHHAFYSTLFNEQGERSFAGTFLIINIIVSFIVSF